MAGVAFALMAAPPKVVLEAIDRFKLVTDAEAEQRKREKEDLRFQVPDLQWPDDVKRQRAAQNVNGVPIPARPMLSIPTLDQPIQLVLNGEKAAQLGVSIHPISEDADDDTAEVLQGLYRRIEVDSRANLARSWAFERAVKAGRGAYRVLKDYADDGGHFTDQKIVIKRLLHQESAYFDPFAQEPDWSDGEWALITEWMPWDRYRRKYPKSKLARLSSDAFADLVEEQPNWIHEDEGAGRAVLVAEYFRKVYTTRTRVMLKSGRDAYRDAIPEGDEELPGKPTRDEQVASVKWSLINAVEELETEDWDGQYIPIIPVIGRELIPFDGSRRWTGVIGPNKDAVRGFNYAASGAVEAAALEPKAPFDVDPEEIEGFEDWYQQANTRNFPYLPRHKFLHGQVMPPLARVQVDTSKLQIATVLVNTFRDFIHSGTGAFEPVLGQDSTRAKSGRAVLALQQQHDQGTSNFLDNLAEISMTYEAKVVLDLIPHVYDRPGRIARLLDTEDNASSVMLNQPFVMGAPPNARPQAVGVDPVSGQPVNPKAKHYDLKKGRYGVTVSIGKAYKSRVEQGADELGQLFQAEPQLFGILGDLYLKFRDFPGHLEAAERVKKMLPAPLQGGDDQDQGAANQAKLAKAMQMIDLLSKELNQRTQQIQTDAVKYDYQKQLKAMDIDFQKWRVEQDSETKIAVAQLGAKVDRLSLFLEERARLGLQMQQTIDAQQDRAHEVGMSELEHQQAMEQADQAHQQALDQGAQGVAGTMATQAQAAQLNPPADSGDQASA